MAFKTIIYKSHFNLLKSSKGTKGAYPVMLRADMVCFIEEGTDGLSDIL
jgi:hypothetical protein